MIGQTISHYEILEKSRPEQSSGRGCSVKPIRLDENARLQRHSFRFANGTVLGEVPNFPASVFQLAAGSLSIPLFLSGSGRNSL